MEHNQVRNNPLEKEESYSSTHIRDKTDQERCMTYLTDTPMEAGHHCTWVLLSIQSVLTPVSCMFQGAATQPLPVQKYTLAPILAGIGATGASRDCFITPLTSVTFLALACHARLCRSARALKMMLNSVRS